MEIISGLQNSSIHRLRQLWTSLDKQHQKTYDQLQAVVSRDQSYKALRAQLHSLDPPCVPYLGVYLTDLIFIEDGNPDFVQGGLINFVKCQFVSQVIREIRQYQDVPYCLEPVPFIRDFLLNVKVLPDSEMYAISLQIEPRGSNKDQSPSSSSSKSRLGRQATRTMSVGLYSPPCFSLSISSLVLSVCRLGVEKRRETERRDKSKSRGRDGGSLHQSLRRIGGDRRIQIL